MGFRNLIRSLFGAWRLFPLESQNATPVGSGLNLGSADTELEGFESNDNLTSASPHFNIDEWVSNQKATYGSRVGLSEDLEKRATQFNGELLGLSGTILDHLVSQRPCMVPKTVWGGDLGWRSAKRKQSWEKLLDRNGIVASTTNTGMLIRFYIDASEWVPHPYAPPHWATFDFSAFSSYIAPSEDAFRLCVQWRTENSIALTARLEERLQRFPVQIGSSYRCYDHKDYADVAFQLSDNGTDLLQVKNAWKNESALAHLVKRFFPDASREYSPSWLKGQRIDIFIPSLQVAIEFHGQQHYDPVEYFGGRKGFSRTKERDQRKAQACKEAGVILIEWKFTEYIVESNLRRKLKAIGIDVPDNSGR
jgi:hypothetical protein